MVGILVPPLAVAFGTAALVVGFRSRTEPTGRLGLFGGVLVFALGVYMTVWLILLFGFGIDIGPRRR